jgi:hypothetical protein
VFAELEQLMQQVHLMVWPQAGEAAAAAAAATAAQVAAAAAPTPADLQQLPTPTPTPAGSSGSGSDTGLLARQKNLNTLLVDLEASEQLLQLLKDVDQRVQMLMTIE